MSSRILACPRCPQALLDVVAQDGHEVDVCASCRGLWLDAHEWSRVIGPTASPSRLMALGAPRFDAPHCPACAGRADAPRLEPRQMIGADGVVLDACATCHGAWLDGGELAALRQALAVARARMQAPPPLPGGQAPAGSSAPAVKADGGMTMPQAMAATAVSALSFLAQAALTPPPRRGLFGRRRRGPGILGLVGLVLRLLRR